MRSKNKGRMDKGVTLIAAHTEVVGDIRFEDQLFINGRVDGNLVADDAGQATVVVSEEGCVVGEIRGPNVVINGRVEGNVYATAKLELAAKAQVQGNVYYKLIEMQLGAMVDGQLVHDEKLGNGPPNVHPFPADNAAENSARAD
jgi:cytoskeletal protein CcmA (bactofilin family)